MERLTEKARNCDGTAVAKESLVIEYGLRKGTPSNYCCAVLTKLAEYEDLGLEPEQIREMDKLYAEQAKELGEYKKAEEKLNGISLRELAAAYIRTIEKETDEKYSRGRLLTNKEADKWDEYEDLEEQGLLLRLPCKLGDTVYEICDGFIEPCTVEVIFLADYTDKDGKHSYMAEIHYDREDCPYVSAEIYFTDFGKTVFLTQTEAEEALKRMDRET